jgi:phospholipid/cholesterol/gamma-HCH transport system permease protein
MPLSTRQPALKANATSRKWTAEVDGSTVVVALSGDWVARTDGVERGVAPQVLKPGVRALTFDTTKLGHWDSALLAFLLDIRQAAPQAGVAIDDAGLPKPAQRLLKLASDPAADSTSKPPTPFLDRIGLWAIAIWTECVAAIALVGNIVLRGAAALRGRAAMRGGDLIGAMFDAGLAALPIVTVVGLLIGGILAFIGATELSKFGAGVYVANLVSIGMVREMAALMTAIIMAGRTGGAYAANLAAMRGGEEIDALSAMGIPVFDYLILPRILALTGMMPILYLYGCLVGIFGGLCVGAATLGVTATSFFIGAQQSLSGAEFALGFAKSLCFGAFIALIACRIGLRAARNAAAVGHAATTAVVIGIVGVIALDAVFDLCASAVGV